MTSTTDTPVDARFVDVELIFPPLVESNFGRYYPSTAVLAGYLAERGVRARQIDLNERFAVHLLGDTMLDWLGSGGHLPGARDPLTAPAARLLRRARSMLFTDDGRHLFAPTGGRTPHQLLLAVARGLPTAESAEAWAESGPAVRAADTVYHSFFDARCDDVGSAPVVGLSIAMGPQIVPGASLARAIKLRNPDAVVVVGGPAMSLMGEESIGRLLRTGAVDAVVRYDGEDPLVAVSRRVAAGDRDMRGVPGVSTLVRGEVVHTPSVPGPATSGLPFAAYDRRLLADLDDVELGVQVSRGCYWGRCSYCDFVELYGRSPAYRGVGPVRVADEMDHLAQAHGVTSFSLITEALPPATARRLSDELLRRNRRYAWSSFAMVDRRFTRELFELMAAAGCRSLTVGVESMTDRVLRLVDKASDRAQNQDFLRAAGAAGIRLSVNIIPDLPTTTSEEAADSLAAFAAVRESLTRVSVFPFEATASSRLGADPGSYGLEVVERGGSGGQAQFAGNHVRVRDGAMDDLRRADAHRAARTFAEQVNRPDVVRPETPVGSAGVSWRVADEMFEFDSGSDGVRCYVWCTGDWCTVPAEWPQVIDLLRSIQPFTIDDVAGRFELTFRDAAALVDDQARRALLVPCAAPTTEPPSPNEGHP